MAEALFDKAESEIENASDKFGEWIDDAINKLGECGKKFGNYVGIANAVNNTHARYPLLNNNL